MNLDYPELTGLYVLVVEDTWHVGKALKSALEGMPDGFCAMCSTQSVLLTIPEHSLCNTTSNPFVQSGFS